MSDHPPVTVFATQDIGLVAVAKSILEGAGIDFTTQNELFQDLVGKGRLGVNVAAGPTRILVRPEDEEAARQVLAELETTTTSLRMSKSVRWIVVSCLLIIPIILGALIWIIDR